MKRLLEWFFGIFQKPEPRHHLFLSFLAMIEFLESNPNFDYRNGLYFFGFTREVVVTPEKAPGMYIRPTEELTPRGLGHYEHFLHCGLQDAEAEERIGWKPESDMRWRPLPELSRFLVGHGYPALSRDAGEYKLGDLTYSKKWVSNWAKKKKLPLVVHFDEKD